MFFLEFVFLVVGIQNLHNKELHGNDINRSLFILPPRHCTMAVDLVSYTGLMDPVGFVPTVIVPSAMESTTLDLQTNITDSGDEAHKNCMVDANVTSHDTFMDLMDMEQNVIVSSPVEPTSVNPISQTNVTYDADDDFELCTAVANMTSYTEFVDPVDMEPVDVVSPAVLAKTVIIDALDGNLKLLNFADLLFSVYLAVLFFMVMVLLYQRMRVSNLDTVLKNTVKNCIATHKLIRELETVLDDQQSSYTRATFKIAGLNRKIDTVSKELNEEQYDLERMYEGLNDWKQDWLEQSHKIRQINPENLKQLTEQSSSKVDKFVEEQKKEIRDFTLYAGEQFDEIYQKLADNHQIIMAMFADIDAIHDELNEHSARQF